MLRKHWPIFILFFISLILIVKNYTFGTFLSGWDTLHPEFNFPLNLERVLFGVFRDNQGLGALAIHSHISDLPRILFLLLSSVIVPMSFLRYLWVFLMLIVGPIGFYVFAIRYITKNKIGAFLGSLFYLLNLGTLQQFVVPFEMFVTQFGFLPWLFLLATDIVFNQRRQKSLIYFSIVTFFAAPMAYAATLWYVYFFSLLLFLGSILLLNFNQVKRSFKKSYAWIIGLTLGINSFWILPNIYSIFAQGKSVGAAKINRLFSEQAFLYNKEFGNFVDISLLKTFYFDWSIYGGNNNFVQLMSVWNNHLASFSILELRFSFLALALFGLFIAFIKRARISLAFLPVLLLCLFFLINDNFPTGGIYVFLQNHFPLFREAFRFPGDKVLGIYTFAFAVFFTLGVSVISIGLRKLVKKIDLSYLWMIILTTALIFFSLPAFRGELISPYMRINIPDSYFKAFNWFNKQEQGRIANLPINSFWGWEYFDWHEDKKPSYQGAGFFWFGIKQPLLHRDFDRWSSFNEQYYREMSNAVYSKDLIRFKEVLNKYNIKYLMLDESIIAPENDPGVLYFDEIKTLISQLTKEGKIKEKTQFGKITIYSFDNQAQSFILKDVPFVTPQSQANYEDFAYKLLGNYVTFNNLGTHFPFRNLFDNQNRTLKGIVSVTNQGIKMNIKQTKSLPLTLAEAENSIPSDLLITKSKNQFQIGFFPNLPYEGEGSTVPLISETLSPIENPIISINQNHNYILNNIADNTPLLLTTAYLKTNQENSLALFAESEGQVVVPDFNSLSFSLSSCEGNDKKQVFSVEPGKERNSFSLVARKTNLCMIIPLKNIFTEDPESKNSLIKMSYFYEGRANSEICLSDLNNGACLSYPSESTNVGSSNNNSIYFGFKSQEFEKLGIKIMVDATSNFDSRISFNNVSFFLLKPFFENSFSPELVNQSVSAVNSINSSSLLIPYSADPDFNLNVLDQPNTNINCDQNPEKIEGIEKKISSDYIRYTARNGTLCDHFSYNNIDQDQAYLLIIESRNVQGLPLSFCLLNQSSKHCDIYTSLTSSKEFVKDTFLVSPMINGEKGYDVNFSGLGIRGTDSINEVRSIKFVPFPYNWLSQFNLSENQEKGKVFVLSSSFQSGWKAYITKDWLQKAFPTVFGKELKKHVLVNNWANGWIIDEENNLKENQISTVYIPQNLELLGFILLAGIIIYLIKFSSKRSKN